MKHIFQQGNKFQIGCNYWASHAGPDMWRDWDAEQVDRDFAVLATYELDCVRVFPTWRDFQPFIRHCGCMNDTVELRRGEMPRTGDFEEYSGVDPVMLERFHVLSQLALKHNLKLIVSLVTGWMSGRMFVPQAFEQSRLLTDPAVIHEEVRYVRTLVRSLKNEPAIIAWEPGNESNCMERVSDIQMWHWFDTICNAIRREDGSRPVFSGTNTRVGGSQIADMRECADVLNAHSYPAFSRFCRVDPIDTMRNSFQATFMNRCNCDIGHTDSFIEETGAFGPCQTSDETAGRHLQNQLWNAYAHDCRGLLWWCAFEQTHLDRTPYDWSSMERTMGLFYPDGTPKPYTEKFAQ
ncbi:MAG: hypothetical protein J6S21_02595, partial [Victivallales bacterium]|nr:hypothetical protein [Victivallales bacterium]